MYLNKLHSFVTVPEMAGISNGLLLKGISNRLLLATAAPTAPIMPADIFPVFSSVGSMSSTSYAFARSTCSRSFFFVVVLARAV